MKSVLAMMKSARRTLRSRFEAAKYLDPHVCDLDYGNRILYDAVSSGEPQAIGKLGARELFALRNYLRLSGRHDIDELTAQDRSALGLFPDTVASFERYAKLMFAEVLPALSVMAVWFNPGEATTLKRFSPDARRIPLLALESYLSPAPRWTRALEGKNVLVMTPFVETIRRQYAKRREVWRGNEDVLPDFNLMQIRVPYHISLAPPTHASWFDVLDDLQEQMAKMDFDVALIGALVYSLPLAAYAKRLGKQGLHLGGSTQIYFGIKGRRWESIPEISALFNESWCRPLPDEVPAASASIEGGAYW